MTFKTIGDVQKQYNYLGLDDLVMQARGVVLSPADYKHMKTIGAVTKSAQIDNEMGERLLGLAVSSSPAVPDGHCLWIGETFRALLFTDDKGAIHAIKEN